MRNIHFCLSKKGIEDSWWDRERKLDAKLGNELDDQFSDMGS